MFVSHEKNVGKKTFQKPNILRRKPKVPRSNISNINESPGTKSQVLSAHLDNTSLPYQEYVQITKNDRSNISKPNITKKSLLKFTKANNNVEKSDVSQSMETDNDANINSYATVTHYTTLINNGERPVEQSSLNIESFINREATQQKIHLPNDNVILCPEKIEPEATPDWCFDLTNHDNISALVVTDEKSGDGIVDIVPPIVATILDEPITHTNDIICSPVPTQSTSVELFSNRAVKYKCDEPNCSKGFWTEERLIKHKNSHNKKSSVRPPSQINVKCPVKIVLDDDVEEKCPRVFQTRRELLKHLNADHTLEDALHRCEVCGRRFFWASGLRAHAQSECARGGLACDWPGCTRVFRLPCRLREHARAHTGDRPYLCKYPECGWAFRSASKLVRHARRHTNERRHACGACGRAFLRREHLREHTVRHHLPQRRAAHKCPQPGCEQTFTNMSSLYMHMKRVHREGEGGGAASAVVERASSTVGSAESIYLVNVVGETGTDDVSGEETGTESHAARTHCTWPLASRRVTSHDVLHDALPDELHDHTLHSPVGDTAFVLEEDVHVETAEGSTSDVYTVRSDLFLHGNVPIDDDSQNIGVAEMTAVGEVATPIDTDLCLIDSHPTIDLMQEELMYEDAAVDESSFRVFLMNGEELT